jgi:chloride channel 3/4/5
LKFTGDFLARDGIYESWIKLRSYPFLDPKIEYRRDTVFVRNIMTPIEEIVTIRQSDWTVSELEAFVKEHPYRGYPIVTSDQDKILSGYILRNDLLAALSTSGWVKDNAN